MNVYYCVLFSSRIRVRIRFSVWMVSCYAHVFVLVSIVTVTLPIAEFAWNCQHGCWQHSDEFTRWRQLLQWLTRINVLQETPVRRCRCGAVLLHVGHRSVKPVQAKRHSRRQLTNYTLLFTQARTKQWRSQKFWRGRGGRKRMYRPRHHLSQMHTTNHMPFIREKAACWKNSEPIGGGATAPTAPPPLNPPLKLYHISSARFVSEFVK